MFGPKIGISYVKMTENGETEHRFDPVEQFGNETEYFSECMLNDRHPEADREEGLLDMIVLATVEPSLETGETTAVEPRTRVRSVAPDQALKLRPAKQSAEDDMINGIPQSA